MAASANQPSPPRTSNRLPVQTAARTHARTVAIFRGWFKIKQPQKLNRKDSVMPGAEPNTSHLIEFHGAKLIRSKLISPAVFREIETGRYEGEEIACALINIEPADVVLELGAGIGALSSVILTRKQAASWVCVEANPELIPLIRKNHKLNGLGNVEVISGMLSNDPEPEEHDFYVTEDFWASSLTRPAAFKEIKKIPGHRFGDVLARYRPTFIICDIEGGEYELFTPRADLAGVRKLCIEIHPAPRENLEGLETFLVAEGFLLDRPPLRLGVNYWRR